MKKAPRLAAAALLSLSAVTLSATAASAAIVCNHDGQCWHVRHRYNYRPDYGVVVHQDNWRWGPHDHYVWREHTGRGYWHHGRWVRF